MTTAQLLDAAALMLATSWEMSPEEFDERLGAWLDESADKLAALRAVAKAAEAMAAAHKAEAEAHAARVKQGKATVERAKERAYALLCAMREAGGEASVPGVARIQKNGGKPPLVFAPGFDVGALPDACKRVVVEPDNDAIRRALEAGIAIDGVTIGEAGEGVRWA